MTIITISRGSFSKGKEVAERCAERLGYSCISRDVLLDASDRYNIPEIRLVRAIHDAPSIIERLTHGRQAYVAYIRSALVERALAGDLVYHGLAGHLLLLGVDHLLKVRIISDMEDRIAQEMQRENVSADAARALLERDDSERRKWTMSLFGVDPCDPALYDLVIHIQRFQVADAVDLICRSAGLPQYAATAASQQRLADLALACRFKAELVEQFVDAAVSCEYGNVLVYVNRGDRQLRKIESRVKEIAAAVGGVNNVEVHAGTVIPAGTV